MCVVVHLRFFCGGPSNGVICVVIRKFKDKECRLRRLRQITPGLRGVDIHLQ